MIVTNISDINYFLNQTAVLDKSTHYTVNYHPDAPEKNFKSNETFVIELQNCLANTLPLLVTDTNEMITEHVWPLVHKEKHKPHHSHKLWSKWQDKMQINLPGPTAYFNNDRNYVWLPVDDRSTENPWHVWIDMISKFRLIEKQYKKSYLDFTYIIPKQSNYLKRVMNSRFHNLNYHFMTPDTTWKFEKLIVPSMSNRKDGMIVPEMPSWLRENFGVKEDKPFRKIWISRKNSATRSIVNESVLFDTVLKQRGWELLELENLSLDQQLHYFAEAQVVVAPHGAGLTNLLFCQPGTKVIELQDKDMLSKKVYPVLAYHLGLEQVTYTPDTIKIELNDGKKPKGIKRMSDLINFKITHEQLLELLKATTI